MSLPKLYEFSFISLVSASILSLTAFGCGTGPIDNTIPVTSNAEEHPLSGQLYGGPTPLVGATVKIYATGNSSGASTGYGVGTVLAEADQVGTLHQDTDTMGNFYFSTKYSCPAGQFAYIVATGGATGGAAANSNSALVAALGRCEDLYNYNASSGTYSGWKSGNIFINELTTIAAAYALGHFSTEVNAGQGASTQILIGAPATNNAAQVSGVSTGCVAGVGSCSTTAVAGLVHAFINASLLVNTSVNTGLNGSGANATVPGNSGAVVPQRLINTLGNILVTCVNSTGGTTNGTACGKLFTYTTSGTSTPTDTWGAMVNLAANPSLSGGVSNSISKLYNLISPSLNVYTPYYTSATGINDYSIGINYPASAFNLTYPYTGATDINDVFYVGSTAGAGTSPARIVAFNYTQSSTPSMTVNSSATNSNFTYAYGLSLDALGHGYFGNGSGGSSSNGLGYFSTNGGSPSAITASGITATPGNGVYYNNVSQVFATAVDAHNRPWFYGQATGLTYYIYQCPASFTSSSNCTGVSGGTNWGSTTEGAMLAIDPNQNVWNGSLHNFSVIPNTGSLTTPTYTGTAISESTVVDPVLGVAFTAGSSSTNFNAYVSGYKTNNQPGVQSYSATLTSAAVSAIGGGTNHFGSLTASATSMSGPYGVFADGLSNVWAADYADSAVFLTNPSSSTSYKLAPCIGGTTATTCSSIFTSSSGSTNPTSVSVDAAGSVWVTAVYPSSPYSGQVVEIIGSAAPTWPLLSLGKTGQP